MTLHEEELCDRLFAILAKALPTIKEYVEKSKQIDEPVRCRQSALHTIAKWMEMPPEEVAEVAYWYAKMELDGTHEALLGKKKKEKRNDPQN